MARSGGTWALRTGRLAECVAAKRHATNNTASGAKQWMTAQQYCFQQVRTQDYENYLCGLLLPAAAARRGFFAIRAWNIETANIKSVVNESMMAKIRIQWWRDILTQLYKNPNAEPPTPVAQEIALAIQAFKLTKGYFSRVLDRREKDIDNAPIVTLEDLEKYCEDTYSSLLYLTLECLGVRNVTADHAASHIGKSLGMCVLLRGTPHHASKRHTYLPLSLLAKHSVSQEDLFRGEPPPQLTDVAYEVASHAKLQLDKARALKRNIPAQAMPALFSSAIADGFLHRLQHSHFNVFDARLARRDARLYWRLLRDRIQSSF